MCRLFGFRSVIQSQVHHSLVSAENALESQSQAHPHGWGVAYYVAGTPHVIKSEKTALNDHLFKRVSGVVSSQTVLAHVRNATEGSIDLLNTHPFQFGQWVFAHNGNIKDFKNFRGPLLRHISPKLRPFILGETDSELIFFLILSELAQKVDLSDRLTPFEEIHGATQRAIALITGIIGNFCADDQAGDKETYLTFIITNGRSMLAHHGGKKLFYSTHKNRCAERDTCPSFASVCEQAAVSGAVNHLIFASEPLSGDNIWLPLRLGQIVGVDCSMNFILDSNVLT
jgi:predicted glutamine amidotransferase